MALDKRDIEVTTPLGEDLMFSEMNGHDGISQCFEFSLTMVSEDLDVAAEKLLGQPVTVRVGTGDVKRYFNGVVNTFALVDIKHGLAIYNATLVPWLWFLSTSVDNRIFQNMSVPEIIEAVFGDYANAAYSMNLRGSYDPREYCVQYGETNLNFVERLMQAEGISYYFDYEDGAHTMVLVDQNAEFKPAEFHDTLAFEPDASTSLKERDFITGWQRSSQVTTGVYTHTSYDFTKPAADLMATSDSPMGHELDGGERYHYPGRYTAVSRGDDLALQRREGVQADFTLVAAKGNARMLWAGRTFTLEDYPRDDQNDTYLVRETTYTMWDEQYRSGMSREGEGYAIDLVLQPLSQPWRPPRRAHKQRIRGPQTAVVVGPAGEEIYTDEYSRVKVHFHWDRLGGKDENSSIFVRVSSVWAGSGWGFIQIPRIGQEVIVDFLEGDPDQPIITGRVYNAAQMPPYSLPDNATQSGWKSNSSPGGGGWNELRFEDKKGSEEVYFQAEKDHNELVKNDETRTIGHDWVEDVGNDATQSIGHDRTESVANDKSTSVGNNRSVSIGVNDDETVGSNRSLTVGSNETIKVGANSDESIGANHTQNVAIAQTLTVGAARSRAVGGAETVGIGAAQTIGVASNRSVTVGSDQSHNIASDDSTNVGGGQSLSVGKDRSISVGGMQAVEIAKDEKVEIGGKQETQIAKDSLLQVNGSTQIKIGKDLSIEAGDSISLKTGSAVITMKKDGTITIEGKDITVQGSGKINVKASSDITMKGSKINQN